jgi:hypothetical protein
MVAYPGPECYTGGYMAVLKKKQSYGPDVVLIEGGLVEKTYRNRIWPVRLAGRVLTTWEAFIYTKLDGLDGIPKLVGRPDKFTILTTYMGGKNLRETPIAPDKAYFENMAVLIERMHSRGVIHLDMRNRRNYGRDDAGKPYLVDFASALYLPWDGWLRRLLAKLDWLGFIKVKAKLAPELLNAIEQRRYRTGETLSALWLPTKVFNAAKDAIKVVRRSFRSRGL